MKYFIAINGQSSGPFSESEIKRMNISPDTLVWREGLADWVRLDALDEFQTIASFGAGQAVPPPFRADAFRTTQPPSPRGTVPPPPYSHLAEAIIVTIFCCLPAGIYAIVLASKVNTLYDRGQYAEAEKTSKLALKWVLWSIGITAVFYLIYILAILLFGFNALGVVV